MGFVLDASVACAWVFADEGSPELDSLLDQLATDEAFVPPLWRSEVLNTLIQAARRGRINAAQIRQYWAYLQQLPIRQHTGELSVDQVIDLSNKYHLTAYDSHYLVLALQLNLPLATLDQPLSAAANGEGVSVLGMVVDDAAGAPAAD